MHFDCSGDSQVSSSPGLLCRSHQTRSLHCSAIATRNITTDTVAVAFSLQAGVFALACTHVHFVRRSELSNKSCFIVDSSSLCKTTPTRLCLRRWLVLCQLTCEKRPCQRRSLHGNQSSTDFTTLLRSLTCGSRWRHCERHAVSPSPGPGFTTWSNATDRHVITKMSANCLHASRASWFTSRDTLLCTTL